MLSWIDEEAALYCIIQLVNIHVATKFMSEINFVASEKEDDNIEIALYVLKFGVASHVQYCQIPNRMTHQTIITADEITIVNLDQDRSTKPHCKTKIEYVYDRLKNSK